MPIGQGRDIKNLSSCLYCGEFTEEKVDGKPECFICQQESGDYVRRRLLKRSKLKVNQAR